MNFEDEPYFRLYTRDTKTWLKLGFEGQTLLMHLGRKLDRSGVLDGIDDPVADVALVTGVPAPFVAIGLPRLLALGVFVHRGDCLVMPNYVEAQSCAKSDRLRQQELRERRRLDALNDTADSAMPLTSAAPVTKRDGSSRDVTAVTERHAPSRVVTPICALPSLSLPSERETRAHDSVPDVPGLERVLPSPPAPLPLRAPAPLHGPALPGPLPPGPRERALTARAEALADNGAPRHEYTPGWEPVKANQARGHELGLDDDEIWARWETCKDKYYPQPFRSDVRQFNRELAFAAQDKQTAQFKQHSRAERDAFEMPGRQRRPA